MERTKYKISKDKRGLVVYYDDKTSYHIHSAELSKLEKWIKKLLLKGE